MKLSGTGTKQTKFVNPFGSLLDKPYKQAVGAGIGVNRLEAGFRGKDDSLGLDSMGETFANRQEPAPTRGETEKVRNPANQALGETPQRDGPFAFGAESVATNYPTGAIKKKSAVARERRQSALSTRVFR